MCGPKLRLHEMPRPRRPTPKGIKLPKAQVSATDEFEFPIRTKAGKVIETVGEAFAFIDGLPAKTQRRPEWQLAICELHRAVTQDRSWLFFARMAINRAIHRKASDAPMPRARKQDAWREPPAGTEPIEMGCTRATSAFLSAQRTLKLDKAVRLLRATNATGDIVRRANRPCFFGLARA